MKTYTITIVETRTLTFPLEATSEGEALGIATQEYFDNITEVSNEQWSVSTSITCKENK